MYDIILYVNYKEGNMKPVSYTHLDVYKRQTYPNCLAKARAMVLFPAPPGPSMAIAFILFPPYCMEFAASRPVQNAICRLKPPV